MFLFLVLFQLISEPAHAFQVAGVECVLDLPESSSALEPNPLPTLIPRSQKSDASWDFRFYLDNDDKMMGLWGFVFPKSSNDMGYTHGMNLEVARSQARWEWRGKVGTALYTRMPSRVLYPATGMRSMLYFYDPNGLPEPGGVPMYETYEAEHESDEAFSKLDGADLRAMVRFVDVTRAEVSARFGKSRYVEASVGAEIRRREPSQPSPARAIQDWWHGQVLNTYRYDYVSPNAEAPVMGAPQDFSARVMDEYGRTFFERVGEVDTVARPGVSEEQLVEPIAPWSVNVGVKVGGREEIRTRCRCRIIVQASGGVQIESEAGRVVGPNSRATVETGVTVEPRVTENGRPGKWALSLSQSVNVHPTGALGLGTRFGSLTRIEAETRFGQKRAIRPFLALWIPRGRKVFHEFNDSDSIMRIGVRVRLQK